MRSVILALALLLAPNEAAADIWPSSHARVAEALESGDVSERRAAASKLGSLPPSLGRVLAKKALADPDTEVRLLAARGAAALGVEGAGDEVVGWLQERDARLRVAAAELIEASPTPNSVLALARVLSDSQPDVRKAAAAAMGGSGLTDAVSPLLGHLDDSAPEVRLEVVRALGRIGDGRAVVPLVSKLQDQEEEVRREAARALGRLGDAKATTTLMLALQDKSLAVRVQALEALGALSADEATTAIASLVTGRGGERAEGAVRDAALEALGRIGSAGAVALLVAELESEGPVPLGERAPVRAALALAGKPAAAALVTTLRGSPSQRLASAAVLALGAMGSVASLASIEQATRRGTAALDAGLRALGALGDEAALPFVLEHLDDADGRTRRIAVEVATELLDPAQKDGRAVDVVRARVTDLATPIGERMALARLLGQSGSARAEPLLAELASQPSLPLERAALEALGVLAAGGAKTDAVLLEALDDDEPSVREIAASALARVGSDAAAAQLLRRLGESAEQDRAALGIALSGALARSRNPALVSEVEKRLASASAASRDALIEGLGRMPIPAAGALLAKLHKRADAADRRKIAEALAGHAQQEAALLALVADVDPTVRANAVWSLGAVGGPAARALLHERLADLDVAVAGNAALSLARIDARAGKTEAVKVALCDSLGDYRAYVRASALSGLRVLEERCKGRELTLLLRDENWRVREAAARLLRATAAGNPAAQRALWRCAVEDRDATVAARCEAAEAPPEGRHDVLVYVVPHGHTTPAREAPFALVLPDGIMRLGVADRRGAVFVRSAPAGMLTLAVPAALAR